MGDEKKRRPAENYKRGAGRTNRGGKRAQKEFTPKKK